MTKQLLINSGTKFLRILKNQIYKVSSGEAELEQINLEENAILEFSSRVLCKNVVLGENSKLIVRDLMECNNVVLSMNSNIFYQELRGYQISVIGDFNQLHCLVAINRAAIINFSKYDNFNNETLDMWGQANGILLFDMWHREPETILDSATLWGDNNSTIIGTQNNIE